MSTERAQTALKLFEQALSIPVAERSRWVADACGDDQPLVDEVLALLENASNDDPLLHLLDTRLAPGGGGTDTHRSEDALRPGGELEDLRIEEQLGAGGMGVVYRAHQISLNRGVAVKVLAPYLHHSESARRRFAREIAAVARLQHPAIVSVFTSGTADGTAYYVMELIEGPPLSDLLAHFRREPNAALSGSVALREVQQPASEDQAGEITAATMTAATMTAGTVATSAAPTVRATPDSLQGITEVLNHFKADYFRAAATALAGVAEGLAYAHTQQVVHRDVKPSNLLFSADGKLHVGDFGVARLLEEPGVTQPGESLGTAYYMAPEQVAGGRTEIDGRTDVYGLGATLYEMLTLRPPFRGGHRDEVLARIVHRDPQSPRRVNRRVPRSLETICLKALEKDPSRRYATARDLADDLRRFVDRQPLAARPTSLLSRFGRWTARRRLAAATVAITLLLALVAVFFGYGHYISANRWSAAQQRRLFEAAQLAIMSGDLESAEQMMVDAQQLGAPAAKMHLLRGHLLLRSGRFESASAELSRAVALSPRSVAAHSLLARAYAADQRHADSIRVVRESRELDPNSLEDYLFLGQVAAEIERDLDVALAMLDEAVRRHKTSAVARLVRGDILVRRAVETGNPDDAEAALQDILIGRELLTPNALLIGRQLQAHLVAAVTFAAAGDGAAHQRHLQAAGEVAEELAAYPPTYASHRWRAFYYDYQGKSDLAIDQLLELRELRAAFLVLILFREGDFSQALELCDERLQQFRTARYTQFFRAVILSALVVDPRDIVEAFRSEVDEPLDPADALTFTYAVHCLAGSLADAQAACQNIRGSEDSQQVTAGWYLELSDYTCGDISDDRFLEQASDSRTKRCTRQFLVGMTQLAKGDRAAAKRFFAASAEMHIFDQLETYLSGGFVRQLDRVPSWPPWIAQ